MILSHVPSLQNHPMTWIRGDCNHGVCFRPLAGALLHHLNMNILGRAKHVKLNALRNDEVLKCF